MSIPKVNVNRDSDESGINLTPKQKYVVSLFIDGLGELTNVTSDALVAMGQENAVADHTAGQAAIGWGIAWSLSLLLAGGERPNRDEFISIFTSMYDVLSEQTVAEYAKRMATKGNA